MGVDRRSCRIRLDAEDKNTRWMDGRCMNRMSVIQQLESLRKRFVAHKYIS